MPVGLPSELALRRPDIRQAEAQLHAATADIGVAVANFYPSVTLSGSVGLQSLQPWKVFNFNARQYRVGPGITIPIFEGGQLKATLELRKAQQQEAAINYQKTVLSAWHDVDNALTAYQTEQARRDQLAQAVAQNQRALGPGAEPLPGWRGRLPAGADGAAEPAVHPAAACASHNQRLRQSGGAVQGAGRRMGDAVAARPTTICSRLGAPQTVVAH